MSCPTNGLVEICVVEDDVRALSAKLKGNILEVALRSGLHDLPANDGRASERDLLDAVVLADCLTDGVSVSDNKVEDTRGEAGFADHVSGHESSQGCHLGGLHDDSVPGCEGGANLPGKHQDWGRLIRRTTRSRKI